MHPPFARLDFRPAPDATSASPMLFTAPRRVLIAKVLGDVRPVLDAVDAECRAGSHAVGFVAYDAAPAFDRALMVRDGGTIPLAWFGIFDEPAVVADSSAPGGAATWRERTDRAAYGGAVESIRTAIGRGDVYQVNYTVRLDVAFDGNPVSLYRRLLTAQGPGYGAFIHTGTHEIISASPELFFQRRGTHVVSMPMKGTARRGRWNGEDDQRASVLASSAKERAENVMIVDLIRNDLGQIARTGSVETTNLFTVERRPTVLQMTSTVEADVNEHTTTADIFAALFPCGSVTGAPKIAATKMIAALETDPRGVYCGAIGHVAPGGDATFSVAIRTVTIDHDHQRAEYGVGGGITWDSAQTAEYDEMNAKAAILTADLPSFSLIETMRLERGEYVRLERHLARLGDSARYFGFDAPRMVAAARHALLGHASSRGEGILRARLVVTPDAVATVESGPFATTPQPRFALATHAVKRTNRFLFHKTTHRSVYDRHRAEHPEAFDVLLWNEERELTEFTIGNVVLEIGGERVTPSRESGLLAGVFRGQLLDDGAIVERIVTVDDLRRATRIWLVNSVREWVEVFFAATV